MTTSSTPSIRLEPTWTYQEIADATGFSLSLIRKEAAAGHLKHRPRGRLMVATQADIDAWLAGYYERLETRRAARVTRRDQQGKPVPKKRARENTYSVQADADIKAALGLPTK